MQSYLADCARIERAVARIYQHWSGCSGYSEELRELWRGLALDEEQHAKQLELAGRLPGKEALMESCLEQEELKNLLVRVGKILQGVEAENLAPRLALRIAQALEEDFGRVHAISALRFKDADTRQLFDRLSRDEERHRETLGQFVDSFPDVIHH